MENINTIVETIIEGKIKYFYLYNVLSFALGLFGSYFIEFFKTKGKNLATKSDIDLLTSKVESVKYDYLKKIEEYKNELSGKYELEKVLLSSKIQSYQLATSLKVVILQRKSNLGDEQYLMEQFFQQIPALLIHLCSHFKIRKDLGEEIESMEMAYNQIVSYIEEQSKLSGEQKYNIDLARFEKIIDSIQEKLLR